MWLVVAVVLYCVVIWLLGYRTGRLVERRAQARRRAAILDAWEHGLDGGTESGE